MKEYKYFDKHTGKEKHLNYEEQEAFDEACVALADDDFDSDDAIERLKNYPNIIKVYDERGLTLLHYAVDEPNIKAVTVALYLVEHGADIYHKDNQGLTIFNTLVGKLGRKTMSQEIHDAFCRAINLRDAHGNPTTDTIGIVRALIHAESGREVDAEFAAMKMAEEQEQIRKAAEELRVREEAYLKATSFKEKMRIDPDRAYDEYFNDPAVQRSIEYTRKKIAEAEAFVGVALDPESMPEEAQKAIESMYLSHKEKSTTDFAPQTVEELIGEKFIPKSIFSNAIDYLSNQLSALLNMEIDGSLVEATILQLQSLLTMAGSGNLPMGFPHRYNPDDDFEPDFFGGGNGVELLNNSPLFQPQNFQVVTILGNGTLVIASVSDDEHQ